jgi:hypothetical protein
MERGTRLDSVLVRLKRLLDRLEWAGLEFEEDEELGYLRRALRIWGMECVLRYILIFRD